jgi:hypothetical protein
VQQVAIGSGAWTLMVVPELSTVRTAALPTA